jgi:hypothetical protein
LASCDAYASRLVAVSLHHFADGSLFVKRESPAGAK